MIEITIEGKPIPKGRPRFKRIGNFISTYTPSETVKKEQEIKDIFLIKYPKHIPLEGAVAFEAIVYMPIPKSTSKKKTQKMINDEIKPIKRPDLDNIGKLVLDALNGLAFKDDSQVILFHTEKKYSNRPRIKIKVYEI